MRRFSKLWIHRAADNAGWHYHYVKLTNRAIYVSTLFMESGTFARCGVQILAPSDLDVITASSVEVEIDHESPMAQAARRQLDCTVEDLVLDFKSHQT